MLTVQDIKVLRDALDAWVAKEETSAVMSSLLGAMLSSAVEDEDGELEKKMDEHQEQQKMEIEAKKRERKEIAEEIEEKLILIKREIVKSQVEEENGDELSDMEKMIRIDELID